MAQRYLHPLDRTDDYQFRLVTVVKRQNDDKIVSVQAVMVDNNAETLRFLQENMGAIIHNVKMVKQLEALDSIKLTKECRKYDGIPQELAKQLFACGLNKD